MEYQLKQYKPTAEQEYLDYLAARLVEWRNVGQRLGQRFDIPITLRMVRMSAEKQLGCGLYDRSRFEDVCAHLKSKIDNTMLGRRNAARQVRNYHTFSEDQTEEAAARSRHVPGPKKARCIPTATVEPQAETGEARTAQNQKPVCEFLSSGLDSQDRGLTDAQYAAANATRHLLVQAEPMLAAGLADGVVARMLGVSGATLSRAVNACPCQSTVFVNSAAKVARLLALPVERLAPPAARRKESEFAALLQVPEIKTELNRIYAATLGASGAAMLSDRRTGSMALTLKRLGDFPLVPPLLAARLREGSQPKPLVEFLRQWTPEIEAKFRGQKHYDTATVVGRRDLVEELADGTVTPLQPGKVWVFDDMSSNLPFWFELDPAVAETITDRGLRQLVERHGCALGRQGLYAWDWASGAWLGADLIGRLRDAYRASDILRFMRKLVMLHGKPDKMVLERGTWQSKAIAGWSVRDTGAVVEVEKSWAVPDMAQDEQARISDGLAALGIEVIYAYTSRGKPIEGAFNYLQSILPTFAERGEAVNIGRHAGEFEWAARAHLRAGAGVLHPRDLCFVHIDRLADLTLQAMVWDGQHDKARREGKPLELLSARLQAHPLPRATPRDLAVFLPEKRQASIRGGFVTTTVNGQMHQFGHAEHFAELGDATRVDYAFDPDEPTLGAAVYTGRGFVCWADYIPAGPVISARDRSGEAGPQYLRAYKAAHRTAFRALDLASLKPVAIAQQRDGTGSVATVRRGGSEDALPLPARRVPRRSVLDAPTPQEFASRRTRLAASAARARELAEMVEA